MKKMFLIGLMAAMLFFSACEYVEEVIIYHEPYLNIYANVTAADKDLNYVHVFNTTGYGEPDRYEIDSVIYHEFYNPSSGDTIRYETLYIDTSYTVKDAEVAYINGSDTIRFYESAQGVYIPLDTNFVINTGSEYVLYVKTEDFGTVTARERAMAGVEWENTEPCVISLSNPADTLKWNNIANAYNVIFTIHYQYEYWEGYYTFESEEVRQPFWVYDSSNYDKLFNQDPFWEQIYGEWSESDTLELSVSVVAYSDSYLDYKSLEQMQATTGIIRYPTINDFRVNIDGALGAFTSISVSGERKVLFVP